MIKQDPFTAYKRELEMQRKNPSKELSPSPSIPKELIRAMRQKKSIQLAVKPKPFKRASPKAKNEDFKFFTVKNKAEENENTKAGQSMQRSPLRARFNSKIELEQTNNKERLE